MDSSSRQQTTAAAAVATTVTTSRLYYAVIPCSTTEILFPFHINRKAEREKMYVRA